MKIFYIFMKEVFLTTKIHTHTHTPNPAPPALDSKTDALKIKETTVFFKIFLILRMSDKGSNPVFSISFFSPRVTSHVILHIIYESFTEYQTIPAEKI